MINNVVGALLSGLVVCKPSQSDVMLRMFPAGVALGVGEVHYAFASDCFPRPAEDGSLDVRSKVNDRGRENVCKDLVSEWKALEGGRR